MIGDFFIWCAGSDTNVLSNCEDSVRIKHIGIGTLVLIPAFLGLVSMSYALSTLDKVNHNPYIYLGGGLSWGLIVFAFDRFIVSTHKKQEKNFKEFNNVSFYLRLIFAIVIGFAVSHPFVLLYFNGSIQQQITDDKNEKLKQEETNYNTYYQGVRSNLDSLGRRKSNAEKLLTAEQSGIAIHNSFGYSSGITGVGTRVGEIKTAIKSLDSLIATERTRVESRAKTQEHLKNYSQKNIKDYTSTDYLAQEIALEELKKKNEVVGITQVVIIMVFMLVDILPLIFKTFAPFSMYDKILVDDINILRGVNIDNRKKSLQKAYDRIITIYNARKKFDNPFDYKDYLDELGRKYSFSNNVLLGLGLGIGIAAFAYFTGYVDPTTNQLFSLATVLTIIISIVANLMTDLLKFVGNTIKEKA
jgi:hypothetical protein